MTVYRFTIDAICLFPAVSVFSLTSQLLKERVSRLGDSEFVFQASCPRHWKGQWNPLEAKEITSELALGEEVVCILFKVLEEGSA